jgi:hypothetical protein
MVRREQSVKWSVIALYGYLKRWSICRVKHTGRFLSFMTLGRVREADGAGVWDGKRRAEVEYADRGSGQKLDTLIHSAHIFTQPRSDGATQEGRRQAEASGECASDGQARGVELQSPASVGVTVNRYDVTLICFIKGYC